MEDLQYAERIIRLGLMSLEAGIVRGDLIEILKILNGDYTCDLLRPLRR